MKYLTPSERETLIGPYHAPEGLYEYTQIPPFLGTVSNNITTLIAGTWHEILLTYTDGGSGLANGAWIKGTFEFHSECAVFQSSDRTKIDYVSAEYVPRAPLPGQTAATVQELRVRSDEKGHERPFQKALIVDVVDGYLSRWGSDFDETGGSEMGIEGDEVLDICGRAFSLEVSC